MPLVPILLREIIAYDWKFPSERRELDAHLVYLATLTPTALRELTSGFAALALAADLNGSDWAADPEGYMERLTASLWSTHQMPQFRTTAERYTAHVRAAAPAPLETVPRLGVVILGRGVAPGKQVLFRKLRREGIYLNRIQASDGVQVLLDAMKQRAQKQAGSQSYEHWYIDGGSIAPGEATGETLTQISYEALEPARRLLLERAQQVVASGGGGPEALRTLMMHLQPKELGFTSANDDPLLTHFQLSLLTEGSGTQIFSTTFVQWAARECLRRSQPSTLLLRFAPRQRQQGMDELLRGATSAGPDPEGSLVDADMAAYYTWLNMLRLPNVEQVRFLARHEDGNEAVAIGPGLPRGTTSSSQFDMHKLLALVT